MATTTPITELAEAKAWHDYVTSEWAHKRADYDEVVEAATFEAKAKARYYISLGKVDVAVEIMDQDNARVADWEEEKEAREIVKAIVDGVKAAVTMQRGDTLYLEAGETMIDITKNA